MFNPQICAPKGEIFTQLLKFITTHFIETNLIKEA